MTAVIAAFATEAELLRALDRLRSADLTEIETFSPLPVTEEMDSPPRSWLPAFSLAGGIAGAAFMLGLETISTVSSWGYPVDIGGRPAFSWPAYIPIAVSFGIAVAALASLASYAVATKIWRLWDAVDEFDAMTAASRNRWLIKVEFEEERLLDRARMVLLPLRPHAMRIISHDLEEVPA